VHAEPALQLEEAKQMLEASELLIEATANEIAMKTRLASADCSGAKLTSRRSSTAGGSATAQGYERIRLLSVVALAKSMAFICSRAAR
jgi:hypothetical protein